MLFYLFEFLEKTYDLPGAGLFRYISFRSGAAMILSLLITIYFGKRIISSLKKHQIGESVRELGLDGQKEKEGTPTMGGIIIIMAIMIPTLLLCQLHNVYVWLMMIVTMWMALIGFADDYIKVFRKDKKGLHGKFKILGQVGLGILIATVFLYHPDILLRIPYEEIKSGDHQYLADQVQRVSANGEFAYVKSTLTNVPFFKDNNLDYSSIIGFLNHPAQWVWMIFIPFCVFIVAAISNGANLTDGIDGLATGTSAIIAATLAVLAYVSGNTIFADYLNIFYIPESSELVVYLASFLGACIGFLWYNAFPAKVFMGDTGSLAIGGIIAAVAILLRKELLLPILCGIFLMENLSVVMQVSYFKYTKRKFGEGKRIFLMSPLHHHYQKLGMHESKIVTRFWIVGVLLAVLTIITLKVR